MNYCSMCGSAIPKGQNVCSMCYGDPFYGRDGYYLAYLKEMYEEASKLEEELMAWEEASDEILRYPGWEEE